MDESNVDRSDNANDRTDPPQHDVEQEIVDVPGAPAGLRWWPAALIVGLAVVVDSIMWWVARENRPIQSVTLWLTGMIVPALLLIWWMFASRVRWKTRFIGLGIVVLGVIGFRSMFRVDEFTGELFPVLSFRWSQTAEAAAAEYRETQSVSKKMADSGGIDEIVVTAGDWPQFRGIDRHGNVPDSGIRTDWEEHPPEEIWRHPIGPGWSSFIVMGGLAITQEQHLEDEAVVCYDAESGEQIWSHSDRTRFSESMGSDGPRATPTYFDGLVYAQGATGQLNCLDAHTGEVVWAKNILDDTGAKLLQWGMSGSPLVFDDLVVVNAGGPDNAGVVAYDRLTGERVWAAGQGAASYSSPRLAELHGVRQILVFSGNGLTGHQPETGDVLWHLPWQVSPKVNAIVPYQIGEDQLFIASGYSVGAGLVNVLRDGEEWTAEQVWKSIRLKAKFNDVVVKDGFVYGLDEGVLTCLDLKTGKRKWKAGRFGYGQILLLDDLLLVLAESGEVLLIKAEPKKSKPLARFQAIEGKTWNHPTLVRGRLFVRNAREAACYDISQ